MKLKRNKKYVLYEEQTSKIKAREEKLSGMMMNEAQNQKLKLSKPVFYMVIAILIVSVVQLVISVSHLRGLRRQIIMSPTHAGFEDYYFRAGSITQDAVSLGLSIAAIIFAVIPKRVTHIIAIILIIAAFVARFVLPGTYIIGQ